MPKRSTSFYFVYDPNAEPGTRPRAFPWSENTTQDLIAALKHGDSIEEAAMFLQFSEETVRAKMHEFGLEEPSH